MYMLNSGGAQVFETDHRLVCAFGILPSEPTSLNLFKNMLFIAIAVPGFTLYRFLIKG